MSDDATSGAAPVAGTPTGTTIRVAAVQFATGTEVEENLATVCRMIATAAEDGPALMVLPEFCNHLSIYDDGDHAWRVAIDVPGPWTDAVGALAARHACWIQLNCTVRRDGESTSRQPTPGRITNTNLVFSPSGELVATSDKTVLMGAEGDFLSGAVAESVLVDTGTAMLGSYACMDGVVPEVPRSVAVRGAQVMCNSLNSFVLDEASLHIPVRAAENKAWVVASCKVGSLLPPDKVDWFVANMGVPAEYLHGAGESQIVAPDGTVVAQGPRTGEAVVVADIDAKVALDKRRPDGTDVFAGRRPELYASLARPTPAPDDHGRAESLRVAVTVDVDDAITTLAVDGARLVVVPELLLELDDLAGVADLLVTTDTVVVTSVRDGATHLGVVVSADGVIHRQPQLHGVARHPWSTVLGDAIVPLDLAWGRLAVVVGDDLVYPEVMRLAALAGCDVVAVPFAAQEAWECRLGLVERAAENRICVVAATLPSELGTGLIVDLPPDFTLWAPSCHRLFDGTINRPDVQRADVAGRAVGEVHPARSTNRQISKGTNLVDGRPWWLCEVLTRPVLTRPV